MTNSLLDFYGAFFMLVAIGGLLLWFMRSQAAGSTRRMTAMMKRAGLDPGAAAFGDTQAAVLLRVARRRCGNCPREEFCERWLAGKVGGDNAFCRNAESFRGLIGAI